MLLSALLPEVLPFVKSCPQMVATRYLRKAAIEFCERTLVWTTSFSLVYSSALALSPMLTDDDGVPITSTSDQQVQSTVGSDGFGDLEATRLLLPLESDRQMVKLQRVRVNDADVHVLNTDAGIGAYRNESGMDGAWSEDLKHVWITPKPTDPASIYKIDVALKPSETANTIDDILGAQFPDALVKGALARLYAMPDQPWTDQVLAEKKAEEFKTEYRRVARRVAKGFGRGGRTVRPFYI